MKLLLDTCTFLWVTFNSPQLSALAFGMIRDPANEVYLSVVSTWEICVKYSAGKLSLPAAPDQFIPVQRQLHGIRSLLLDDAAVMRELQLPKLHKDPFDRMLVCQAIEHGMTILTPDPILSQYPVQVQW